MRFSVTAIAAASLLTVVKCLELRSSGSEEKPILLDDDKYILFEHVSTIPHPWILKDGGVVDPDQPFKLRIHLKNLNTEAFQKKVMDLSTPGHSTYGEHMTREEVNNFLSPLPESFQLVNAWLNEQDVGSVTPMNDWYVLESTIGKVEKLLQTQYQMFENTETGVSTIRTLGYSLPQSLHRHIDLIAPTIKFSTPSTQRSTIIDFPLDIDSNSNVAATAASIGDTPLPCDNMTITLDCLKDLYNVRDYVASTTNGNQYALAGFLEQFAQHADLEKFLTTYDPTSVGADFSTLLVNGGLNTQQNETNATLAKGEANLDIQYAFLAYPAPLVYVSTAGRPPETTPIEVDNEPFLEFLTFLLDNEKIPQTISVSYGDSEFSVPQSYARTVCDLFAQLAGRGVSVLVSSGDAGIGSNCNETLPGALKYTPLFPASCPYVTAVGGTFRVQPEIAVPFSGGGFSDVFPRPAYQEDTIAKFLETTDPAFKQFFNNSGRAYPDIAAQSANFHVFVDGADVLESGTSASAPVVASIIALLNSDRIDRGLPTFGLLNPWLYSNASSGLTDIVSGRGYGCSQVNGSGFPAGVGWDPVTGLGTPDFKKLRELSSGDQVMTRKG